MPDIVRSQELGDVPCPFCGLLCDDLRVAMSGGSATVVANGCAKSRASFAVDADETAARVDGEAADLATAIARAAQILRAARRPRMVSAGTDVAGMRALIELAERCGGSVDHANGNALSRNLRVLQNTGWVGTTLTEVRNRADLLVVAGGGITGRFPRFFERCFGDFETMFEVGPRELWFLGTPPDDLPEALRPVTRSVAVEPVRLAEFFAVLRALLAGREIKEKSVAGVPIAQLSGLLERMRAARYGVLTWAAADLAFPHADLAIQSMCELVRSLNAQTRFSVLPLGGGDADQTAQQVTTWQTGFPVRVDFKGGAPAAGAGHDDEVDAMVFVCALEAGRAPAPCDFPCIVLGRAAKPPVPCSVYIPVSVPGLHHAGHLYRADGVVAIHLRKLAGSALPSAAQALQRILDAIGAAP